MGSACKESVVRNRKATLKRKASELATLCDAEVCVLFYDSNGNFEAWPEDLDKANATIFKYNNISRATKKPKANSKTSLGHSIWDQDLEKLSKESLIGLSNCLDAKIQTLGHKIDRFLMEEMESKADTVQPLYDDQPQVTLGVGVLPIDDGFEIAPNFCCFDGFDININPRDYIAANCNTVMADPFDRLQPSISLAALPPLSVDFSDNATLMAASQSLFDCNNIIDATWPCADYFLGVGNTISTIDDDDGSDQYWNNFKGAVETDQILGSELNFLLEDGEEISYPFPTEDYFGLLV